MRKEEYLQKLEQLLYDIPTEDRQEAMQFYRDYLEDAGDRVEEVIRSLGTPDELARSIKKEVFDGKKDEISTHVLNNKEKRAQKGKLTTAQWILFIVLCLCAAPIIVPVCGAILSVIIAIVLTLVAIVFGAGVAGIALVIASIAVIVFALVKVFFAPITSLVMMGGGLLMVGIGLIGIAFAAWVVFKVLPKLFVWLVDVCSGIVHKK